MFMPWNRLGRNYTLQTTAEIMSFIIVPERVYPGFLMIMGYIFSAQNISDIIGFDNFVVLSVSLINSRGDQ
jgi:hypothetical protein